MTPVFSRTDAKRFFFLFLSSCKSNCIDKQKLDRNGDPHRAAWIKFGDTFTKTRWSFVSPFVSSSQSLIKWPVS